MKILIATATLLLSMPSVAPAIELWDSLPALEPTHLQGAYAGSRVCPVCRHGYDSGILVFVPSSTTAAKATLLRNSLAPDALVPDETRFRVFVIVAGKPSNALLASLRAEHPRWYVASLSGDSMAAATRDLGAPVNQALHAYVFSQRRLIGVLSETDLLDPRTERKHRNIGYAMRFLEMMHPTTANEAPPASQGAMWFAPSRLTSIVGTQRAGHQGKATCFTSEDASPIVGALARVTSRTGAQPEWARTDPSGCLDLHRPANGDSVLITFYRIGGIELHALVEASSTHTKAIRASNTLTHAHEPIVGLPCEGCEDVFLDRPENIGFQSRIAPADEPGERLQLTGRVFDTKGQPAADVVVYAYHTATNGHYPRLTDREGKVATRHGRLRGWARTDASGRYAFDTIRPGSYPARRDPQHIHMHVIEPGRCTYYIGDVLFDGDPRLTSQHRDKERTARGGSGVVTPRKSEHGTWHASRDIYLGSHVPGYAGCE